MKHLKSFYSVISFRLLKWFLFVSALGKIESELMIAWIIGKKNFRLCNSPKLGKMDLYKVFIIERKIYMLEWRRTIGTLKLSDLKGIRGWLQGFSPGYLGESLTEEYFWHCAANWSVNLLYFLSALIFTRSQVFLYLELWALLIKII